MRLYNVETQKFEVFNRQTPPYIIASHRWASDADEISYQDVLVRRSADSMGPSVYPFVARTAKFAKPGYRKLDRFVAYIKARYPNIKWLWIDTCCIGKTNAVELSEAINSMFKWYKAAHACVAYLVDVQTCSSLSATLSRRVVIAQFQVSEWFQRGWTLQELVAPALVVFLSRNWEIIGTKGRSELDKSLALENKINAVTGIPINVLSDATNAELVTAEERLSLLGAPIGANYGEGADRARKRLLTELEDIGAIGIGRAAAIAQDLDTVDVEPSSSTLILPDRGTDSVSAEGIDEIDILADIDSRYSIYGKSIKHLPAEYWRDSSFPRLQDIRLGRQMSNYKPEDKG
ncbi:hypothetical protein LTR95_016637 [Oleoguttula sp. CCFEE 5521]